MYTYGGWDSFNNDTGCLYELSQKSLIWQLLFKEGPTKKIGCEMEAIMDVLVCFGGSTKSQIGSIQFGSQCVEINDEYHTNELHVYNLKRSEYVL